LCIHVMDLGYERPPLTTVVTHKLVQVQRARDRKMPSDIRGLLLKILGVGLGVGLDILSFVFPDATRTFITATLGISDMTLVSWIVTGMALFGVLMVLLIIGVTVRQHYRRAKSKVPRVEMGSDKFRSLMEGLDNRVTPIQITIQVYRTKPSFKKE
jgi:hypothetical protein